MKWEFVHHVDGRSDCLAYVQDMLLGREYSAELDLP